MEYGGIDLEHFKIGNHARSILTQLCHYLQAATLVGFDHRDLHWGNVLVKECTSVTLPVFKDGKIEVKKLQTKVKCNLIDFTLSRLPSVDGILYSDLDEIEGIYEGDGDLQFDIYRQMKGQDWSEYNPRNNVLWIHYLVDKLISKGSKGLIKLRSRILSYNSVDEILTDPFFTS